MIETSVWFEKSAPIAIKLVGDIDNPPNDPTQTVAFFTPSQQEIDEILLYESEEFDYTDMPAWR